MPTYEYECSGCGGRFEVFQSITAAPLEKCKSCGKKLTRLIGLGGGVIFKGSGFYATDYRSEQYKKQEKREQDIAGTGKKDSAGAGTKDAAGTEKKGSTEKQARHDKKSDTGGGSGTAEGSAG